MKVSLSFLLLFGAMGVLAGCRAPGRDIVALPGDFALLEVQLRG